VHVAWVAAAPADTLAERLVEAVDERTAAVLASAVQFETARVVPHLDALAEGCARLGVELLVDAYHALGVVPFPIHDLGLASAWVVAGGYKYLQLGEGNCMLRLPRQAEAMRPVITGWYAEFEDLAQPIELVTYGPGAQRFAGATYDPTSHYRAARIFRFFADRGLTPDLLRQSYLHQLDVLRRSFDALDPAEDVIGRDRTTPAESVGGFLALRTPHAGSLQEALRARGVSSDSRGSYLRLGPAPYLADAQLEAAVDALGDALRELT
jgi:kynureninase